MGHGSTLLPCLRIPRPTTHAPGRSSPQGFKESMVQPCLSHRFGASERTSSSHRLSSKEVTTCQRPSKRGPGMGSEHLLHWAWQEDLKLRNGP